MSKLRVLSTDPYGLIRIERSYNEYDLNRYGLSLVPLSLWSFACVHPKQENEDYKGSFFTVVVENCI